jgi:hypothetical protein
MKGALFNIIILVNISLVCNNKIEGQTLKICTSLDFILSPFLDFFFTDTIYGI